MTETRQRRIIEEIKKQKYTRVAYLAELFDVSQVTIRKDLDALESQGIIVRYHGKVAISEKPSIPYDKRSEQNNGKKMMIAKAAAALAKNVHSVALDAGSTTALIANEIAGIEHLSIITNSIKAAAALEHASNNVALVGGQMIGQSMCTVGPDAEGYLSTIKSDIVFVGCSGIWDSQGLSTGLRLEGGVKQALIHSGERVVAVFDDSKFFTTSMYLFANFSEIDTIITTTPTIRPKALDRIEELGINIIYADQLNYQ